MDWIQIIIILSTILLGVYYWTTSTFRFWSSLGVIGPPPLPFVGNIKDIVLGKTSIGECLEKIYTEYRAESVVGIFLRRSPALLLVDLNLIQDVLVKDFTVFTDRGIPTFDKAEPLTLHLLNLETERWRPLRNKLSPAFTSGKLKEMFYLLLESGDHLQSYLDTLLERDEIVECRELTAKFAVDVIGSCAFGLQAHALTDEECEFLKMADRVFKQDWTQIIRTQFRDGFPWLYSKFGHILADKELEDFFTKVMLDTMNYRKNNRVVKHDFIDLLMDIRDHPDKVGDIELTDSLLTAQLFVFFVAGFETSSATMTNALYELAFNQPIQDRLRNEINTVISKNNDKLGYETIQSMKYLDMVMKETLRKWSPALALVRRANEDYTFSGTKLTIPKDTHVVVPIFAIHRDPIIYPHPEVFDPDRFTEEASKARHPMGWMAFGHGPRNCIGARFANYQSKVGLINILQHYKVEVCHKTQIPYLIAPRAFILAPIGGIYLKISKVR